jgi:hypothetical protein
MRWYTRVGRRLLRWVGEAVAAKAAERVAEQLTDERGERDSNRDASPRCGNCDERMVLIYTDGARRWTCPNCDNMPEAA